MEPLDPAKNDESTGFFRRRISSILKAPQKSVRLPDPEQQENVVECAKPVDKRNSRRVSFAPANEVLLFSKDVKNVSPARSPLQELMTTKAAATQNRVQVAITEDGIQHIAGMETLLKAPLHASQQRDEVYFEPGEAFGEKTVMFSTDDAFMDMTHSQTINIASEAELLADISLQNGGVLPTSGDKTVIFTEDEASMDMTLSHTANMTSGLISLPTKSNTESSVAKRGVSPLVTSLDPGFQSFLASLSKQSGPSVNPVTPPAGASSEEPTCPLAQIETKMADVDKENQAPTLPNASGKTGQSFHGGALYPADDAGMDMTEVQTGCIQTFADDDDDDDPFQCLFPTQEMYSHFDSRVPQTAEKTRQWQNSKTPASMDSKDATALKNPPVHASHQRHTVNFDTKEECREKTIMFTTADELMDLTRSHTVKIDSGSLVPPNQHVDIFSTCGKMDNATSLEERQRETRGPPRSSANGLDLGFKNFLASLSKTSAHKSNPGIAGRAPPSTEETKLTAEANHSLSHLKSDAGKKNQSLNATRRFGESFNGDTTCPEDDVHMDMTETQTGRIIGLTSSDDPFQFLFPTQNMHSKGESLRSADATSGQKFSEACGPSTHTGMETSLKPSLKTKVQRHEFNFDTGDDCREKTVRFSVDDACMDVTRSHTVHIATDFESQSHQNLDSLPACGEKTIRFTANDASMDMTQCLTVNIASKFVSDSVLPVTKQQGETCGLSRNRASLAHSSDPGFHTSILKPSGPSVNLMVTRVPPTAAQSFNICPEDDVSMDMTQPGHILGITTADGPPQRLTQDASGHMKKSENTPRQQHSDAKGARKHEGMETSLTASLKTKVRRHSVNFDTDDNCREKTVRFSANDAAMDVTRSHTVNIATDFELHSQSLDRLPTPREKTVRFTANDAAMDVTRSHTVNIATELHSQNLDHLPTCGEKTVRFTANDAAMDVTRSHTVNIATELHSQQNLDVLPTPGEKPVRFSANDAAMDVTRSHTVNIATELHSQQNLDHLPTPGEKPVRFSANDAAMDVTRSHTVNIATELHSQQNLDHLPTPGEKPVRFSANDAAMDVTRSHTVNIATELHSQQNVGILPTSGEKTVRFTANDAAMDVTRSHTVNIATELHSQQNLDVLPTPGEKPVRFSANGAAMNVTRSHTVNIATDFDLHSQQSLDSLPTCGEETMAISANDAAMDVTRSHTVNIATELHSQNLDHLPTPGEKPVRFSANDAAMDVTRSHTVNIATEPHSQQNLDVLPTPGEKPVRFSANDAAMDVTRSHTVNIATELHSQQNVGILPTSGEKPVRFTANDAAMDVTRGHTVNIATELQLHQNLDPSPTSGDQTGFTANNAAMDMTQCYTVNIASDFETQSHQNLDLLPISGEKTMELPASAAAMDMAQCPTVHISSNSVSGSVLPHQDSSFLSTQENMAAPLSVKKRESGTRRSLINRSSSAHTLDSGLKSTLFRKSGTWSNPVATKAAAPATSSPQEPGDTSGVLNEPKTQKPDVDIEKEGQGFVSAEVEGAVNKTLTGCPEDDVGTDLTEAQTGRILTQRCTEEQPQCVYAAQDLYPSCDHTKETKVALQPSSEALESSNVEGVQITDHPDSLDSNETEARDEPDQTSQTCSLSQMESPPGAVDRDADAVPLHNSRQMKLADLHSKVRRLSHMINTAPDTMALDSCTAPLPQLEHATARNSKDDTEFTSAVESETETGLVNAEENAQPESLAEGEQPSAAATPFHLKTKQLMSRLSMGGFKPKLPQRGKCDDPKKATSVGERARTITANVTTQLKSFDGDVSDIYDEELGSCEDMSETLDVRSPQKVTGKVSCPPECDMSESVEDGALERGSVGVCHGKKRPLPSDEEHVEDEKKMRTSSEMDADFEMGLQSHIEECDGNLTTAPGMTTQTADYSNYSHTTSSKCETTFESTFKQSMFASQLEDYASDVQRKLDDGTMTVLEFLKVFNIDFVIHNPRQSVLPGRLLSDTDRTPLDLLKDRHINRPKQTVYEADVLNLTEKVEGLKERMQDLDRPLKTVNRPLWEEMRNYSEKELKSFGAKLKERNNLFRKMAKVQSHEMKEVLYSNFVLANREEQQMLKGKIDEADEMIKSLDDCICQLETELAAVEEKGSEETPSLKSRREEMQRVADALADNERRASELEMEKKQRSHKVKRLKTETRNLESHVAMLHTVNEWKFEGKSDNCTVYTFLHETFHLQLMYENPNGNDADAQSERKISRITFTLQLDDEKSQGHACLVHKLLSQYVERETALVERYPTSRHVPQLLHDVSLVVSRCRLLGEELRLLKTWGGLRLDILNIDCVDTRVHIVFSSLKKVSKFEVVFSVSLTNRICVLQVHSFTSMIGSTTIQQIEEIVASFSPAKNLLTKIVKRIHESLL